MRHIVMPITSRSLVMWDFVEQGERDGPAATPVRGCPEYAKRSEI